MPLVDLKAMLWSTCPNPLSIKTSSSPQVCGRSTLAWIPAYKQGLGHSTRTLATISGQLRFAAGCSGQAWRADLAPRCPGRPQVEELLLLGQNIVIATGPCCLFDLRGQYRAAAIRISPHLDLSQPCSGGPSLLKPHAGTDALILLPKQLPIQGQGSHPEPVHCMKTSLGVQYSPALSLIRRSQQERQAIAIKLCSSKPVSIDQFGMVLRPSSSPLELQAHLRPDPRSRSSPHLCQVSQISPTAAGNTMAAMSHVSV